MDHQITCVRCNPLLVHLPSPGGGCLRGGAEGVLRGVESCLMSLHTWLGGRVGEAGDMSGGCCLMLYTPGFRRGVRPLPATLLYLRLILSSIQLLSVFFFFSAALFPAPRCQLSDSFVRDEKTWYSSVG